MRNAMAMHAVSQIQMISVMVAQDYRTAIEIVGAKQDPVALALEADNRFNVFLFLPAHGHLAAFWRRHTNRLAPPNEASRDRVNLLCDEFHDWLKYEVNRWWLGKGRLIRRFAVLLARWNRVNMLELEEQMMMELTELYPLPRPDTDDFFDNPARFSPYPDVKRNGG
ncbi:hypothetical protein [Neogemmobacter tilapiae]|uniref:hypothetical protein n=1 Tax=Neogemmobacter tilapiae TaxID=875041 RepID=UPI0016718B04|nr:hypothetical protein [Gemmobacter tilapiae]